MNEAASPDSAPPGKLSKPPIQSAFGSAIILAAIAAFLIYRGIAPANLLAIAGAMLILQLVCCSAYVATAAIARLYADAIILFAGAPILWFRVAGVPIRLGWILITSSVRFHGIRTLADPPHRKVFNDLHPLKQAAIAISGPLAMLVIGVILLGPSGSLQLPVKLYHTMHAWQRHEPIANPLTAFVHNASANFGHTIGVLGVIMGAVNCLPLPIVSGGLAVFCIVKWLRPVARE